MQEIELSPPKRDKIITNIPTLQLTPSDVERRDVYKKMLRESLCKFRHFEHEVKWRLDNDVSTTDILLYECDETQRIFKIEGFLDRAAYDVFKMISDFSYTTRSQWFNQMETLKCRESCVNEQFDIGSDYKIRVVQSSYSLQGLVTKPRNLLGLTWNRFNRAKQSYTTIYTSLQDKHEIYKCPSDHTAFHGDYSVWINHVEEEKCFISFLVDCQDLGFITGILLGKLKKSLVEYIILLNTSHVDFHTIYSPWNCEYCLKPNDANLLECRYCTLARYWKCLNKGCKMSQPIDAGSTCVYCKTRKNINEK